MRKEVFGKCNENHLPLLLIQYLRNLGELIMKSRLFILITILIIVAMLSSCAPKSTPTIQPTSIPTGVEGFN